MADSAVSAKGLPPLAELQDRLRRGADWLNRAWRRHVAQGVPYLPEMARALVGWDALYAQWLQAGGQGCPVGSCPSEGVPVCAECYDERVGRKG